MGHVYLGRVLDSHVFAKLTSQLLVSISELNRVSRTGCGAKLYGEPLPDWPWMTGISGKLALECNKGTYSGWDMYIWVGFWIRIYLLKWEVSYWFL